MLEGVSRTGWRYRDPTPGVEELDALRHLRCRRVGRRRILNHHAASSCRETPIVTPTSARRVAGILAGREPHRPRSEEHTSELQSLRHLVCRLLLEKKKQHKSTHT